MLNRIFITIFSFALLIFGANITSSADEMNSSSDQRAFPFLVSSLNFDWVTYGPDKREK